VGPGPWTRVKYRQVIGTFQPKMDFFHFVVFAFLSYVELGYQLKQSHVWSSLILFERTSNPRSKQIIQLVQSAAKTRLNAENIYFI
jgi:hypothetical protein